MPYFSTPPNSVLELTSYLESAPGEVLTSNKFTTLGYLTVSDRCRCHWEKKVVQLKAMLSAVITHVYYKWRWFLDFYPLWRQQLGKDTPLPTNGGDAFVSHGTIVIIQLSLRSFYVKLVKYHIRTHKSHVSQHLKMIYAFMVILKAVIAS